MLDPSEENTHAGQGAVLLDIGGTVGALVVLMPSEMLGVEVEIVRAPSEHGQHRHGQHVAVVARPLGAVMVPSLVFPDLEQGTYEAVGAPRGAGPADRHRDGRRGARSRLAPAGQDRGRLITGGDPTP